MSPTGMLDAEVRQANIESPEHPGDSLRRTQYPDAMPYPAFAELLTQHMRRIRASAADVANEIGMSREAVNNWRNGDSMPGRKHRDRLLACARYLRLTESETNGLLKAAAFEVEFPAEMASANDNPSAQGPSAAITAVLDRLQSLRPYPVMMLLCPAHLGQPPERAGILAEAARRFGNDRILHLQPPYSLTTDASGYFSALAEQAGMAGVTSDFEFEAALAKRLRDRGRLFCLVSRFEQGHPVLRETLAGILRSLSEMHSGTLYLLICGGEALAELKYLGGDLSLLNIAHSERWPEPDRAAMLASAATSGLSASLVDLAIDTSGGHPALLASALDLLQGNPQMTSDALFRSLAESELLWPAFAPLLSEPSTRSRLHEALRQRRVCAARPWLLDASLRKLFWANLLREEADAEGRWFVWRSDAIRHAGLVAVAVADQASTSATVVNKAP